MKISKIEDVMYLVRNNLFWFDDEGYHDWREADVISIKDDEVVLYNPKEELYQNYDLDVLEAKCHALCDEHFALLKTVK